MKNIALSLIALFVLAQACSPPEKLPAEQVKEANVVELQLVRHDGTEFKGRIEDKALLDSLKGMFGQAVEQENACGESGSIQFLHDFGIKFEILLEGKLFLDANCRFILLENGAGKQKFTLDPGLSAALDRMMIPEPQPSGPLVPLRGFLGLWHQVEGIGLVSYEEWKEVDETHFAGQSWTIFNAKDTMFSEKIELVAEGADIYYIPTVKENNGPVRFKLKSLVADTVIFENPAHDFPQIVRYEMGDTLLNASISGTKNGKFGEKVFPLKKLNR